MAEQAIMPGAEPVYRQGGAVGCLCLHGFTACPHEVAWLADHLAAEGHTVLAPRLAGHGTTPGDLARTRWQDWYHSALDAYHILRATCDLVYVAGLSMGGLMALHLAASVSVDGVAVLAAPLVMQRSLRIRSLRWVKYLRPYILADDVTGMPERLKAEQAQRGEPVLGRVRYNRWPTAGIEQLFMLIDATRPLLPTINVPVLAVYSEQDQTVSLDSQQYLVDHLGSVDVSWHTLTESGHILTQDMERETVFAQVAMFIAERVQQ